MEDDLSKLFRFLKKNHAFNQRIQLREMQQILFSCVNIQDRPKRLLFKIVNTQSTPDLDKLAEFFEGIERNKKSVTSYVNFKRYINETYTSETANQRSLSDDFFYALKRAPGWGEKTAALLIRNLVLISKTEELRKGFQWKDVQNITDDMDIHGWKFRLPVDSVIKCIFSDRKWKSIFGDKGDKRVPSFTAINKQITSRYSSMDDMLIWDDLWFWGFITQKGGGKYRVKDGFNKPKYWAIFSSPKDTKTLERLNSLANEFLELTVSSKPNESTR